MKLKLYSILALLLCCTFLKAPAQTGISAELAEKLQTSLNALRESNNVKGISAAVYIPGKGVWKGISGVSHESVALDTNTLLSMGSITKTFVAAEVFKLIEAGKLSLSDTIGSLLPPIQHVNPAITIRQLLGHKSGLAEYLGLPWQDAMLANPSKIWGNREALDSFLTAPVNVPGKTWSYVNTNYILLGMIIESLKSDSLHKILRNDFLMPLALKNTYMHIFENFPNALAHNWSAQNMNPALAQDASLYIPQTPFWTSTAPAGGFMSTPEDLVHWGYNLYSGKVLSSTSLKEMLTFTNLNSYYTGYGLGSMRFTGNGRTYWGHAGNFIGFAASLLYNPTDSVCVALMVNQDCISPNIARPFMNTVLTNITTSINEIAKQEDIRITPNPAFNEVTFSNNTGNYSLKIINNLGKTVYSGTLNSAELNIDTREFANGMYIAILTSPSTTITKKLLIQH